MTGTGAAFNFPPLQNFTIAGGFVDYHSVNCGFFVGCQVARGRDSLAPNSAANLAATEGTFQNLGNGTYRVTLPVVFGLNWDTFSALSGFSALNGTLVATATLPVVDLSNGLGAGDYASSIIATQSPVTITAPGAQATDAAAGATLTSMTVTLTNHPDGAQEKLAVDLSGTSLQGAYNPATGVFTITGTAAPAVYQNVLRRLTYDNTSPTPDTHDRVIQVAVSDGTNASIVHTSTVRVYTLTNTLRVAFATPAVAGLPGSFTVTAAPNYTGTVHFTSSDPQAVLPPDYTFTAADHGVDTFSVTFKTAGSQALGVTDTADRGIDGALSKI